MLCACRDLYEAQMENLNDSLYATKITEHLYEYKKEQNDNKKNRQPQRKRIQIRETYIPKMNENLFEFIMTNQKPDGEPSSYPPCLVVTLADLSSIKNDQYIEEKLREIQQVKIEFVCDDSLTNPGLKFTFQKQIEIDQVRQTEIVFQISIFENSDFMKNTALNQHFLDLIDVIDTYCEKYFAWTRAHFSDKSLGLHKIQKNPVYDFLLLSYILRLITKTEKAMKTWIISILAMRSDASLECVLYSLVGGTRVTGVILDGYTDREKLKMYKQEIKLTSDGKADQVVEKSMILLYGGLGVGLMTSLNIFLRETRQPIPQNSITVDQSINFD